MKRFAAVLAPGKCSDRFPHGHATEIHAIQKCLKQNENLIRTIMIETFWGTTVDVAKAFTDTGSTVSANETATIKLIMDRHSRSRQWRISLNLMEDVKSNADSKNLRCWD